MCGSLSDFGSNVVDELDGAVEIKSYSFPLISLLSLLLHPSTGIHSRTWV